MKDNEYIRPEKYDRMQTMAMLEIIAQGERDIAQGKVIPLDEAFRLIEARLKAKRKPGGR